MLTGSGWLTAQRNYRAIDHRAEETPKSEMTSIARLAAYLTATAKDDYDKARAIYTWMTKYITYSDTTITNGWLGTAENQLRQQPEQVLRNRTGVCEGFANLYKALCTAAQLRAEVVTGTVKEDDGTVADVGHAWNAVQLDGQWYLTDPTWGSGYADFWTRRFAREHREAYFLIPAAEMIQSHLPDDPIWQLLPNPVTDQEFRSLSQSALSIRAGAVAGQWFDYADSIALWFRQDTVQQMIRASERILKFNPNNALALARLGSHFYNQAVTIFFYREEEILNALDSAKLQLDTAAILRQLAQAERDIAKGWLYYHQVKDAKLQLNLDELIPQSAFSAELDYLRGLLHLWQVAKWARWLETASTSLSAGYFDRLYAEASRGHHYFSLAKNVYDNYTGLYYQEAGRKTRLYEALLYNYLAKAEAFVQNINPASTEADIQATFARLDRAEATYQKMNALVREVLTQDSNSIMAASFVREYPVMMAAFQTDRGYVYQFLLQKKYERQWQQPESLSKKTLEEMNTAYRKFGTYADAGLAHLKNIEPDTATAEITDKLRLLKGNMYAYLGDLQARYLIKELNEIKTEIEFKTGKKSFLATCDEVLTYYQQAMEWLGGNGQAVASLRESAQSIRQTRQRLEAY